MRFKSLSTLAAAFLLCPHLLSQDATTFRGDLQHSGLYASPAVAQFTRMKWKFHTSGKVYSSPAVANGMVYFGSTDGNLYAADVGSGTEKWKFDAKSRITSSPAIAGGLVYFGAFDGSF